jgi:hypothetical protein
VALNLLEQLLQVLLLLLLLLLLLFETEVVNILELLAQMLRTFAVPAVPGNLGSASLPCLESNAWRVQCPHISQLWAKMLIPLELLSSMLRTLAAPIFLQSVSVSPLESKSQRVRWPHISQMRTKMLLWPEGVHLLELQSQMLEWRSALMHILQVARWVVGHLLGTFCRREPRVIQRRGLLQTPLSLQLPEPLQSPY